MKETVLRIFVILVTGIVMVFILDELLKFTVRYPGGNYKVILGSLSVALLIPVMFVFGVLLNLGLKKLFKIP